MDDAIAPSEWWPEVRKVDEVLRAGRYKKGEKKARKLSEQVKSKSWHGSELDKVLGEVVFLRAVAEANLGMKREAIWHWHMAINLQPKFRKKDFSPYGDAGKLLLEFPLRARGKGAPEWPIPRPSFESKVERPRAPDFETITILNNTGAFLERPGRTEVEVLVDAEGHFHHPVVLSSHQNPVIRYAVLDWMLDLPPFIPGKVDGKPENSFLELSVQFHFVRW